MHLGTMTGSKRPAAGKGTAERAVRCSADYAAPRRNGNPHSYMGRYVGQMFELSVIV